MEVKTSSCFPYLENGRHEDGDSCEDEDCQPRQPLLPAGGGTCVTQGSGLPQVPTAPACPQDFHWVPAEAFSFLLVVAAHGGGTQQRPWASGSLSQPPSPTRRC